MPLKGRDVFAGTELAARLEGLATAEMRRFVDTARAIDSNSRAAYLEVGGGVAAYLGPDSPVNQTVGMGMRGPVDSLEIAHVEEFFRSRGAVPLVLQCPLADRTLTEALAIRRWSPVGFENVLGRPLDGELPDASVPDGVSIVEVTTDEQRHAWIQLAAESFSGDAEPSPEQLELGRVVIARDGARFFLAMAEGRPAGTAELYIEDGVGWLSADTTAPFARNRGIQSAMQALRLWIAQEAGCDIAVSEAAPGSGSQRNMERAGFTVLYTRVDCAAPVVPAF